MLEKEHYRDNLCRLREVFGVDVDVISGTVAAKYLGVDIRTLKADKHFPIKKIKGKSVVPIIRLASWLS